jgi:hypothetical protein
MVNLVLMMNQRIMICKLNTINLFIEMCRNDKNGMMFFYYQPKDLVPYYGNSL